LFRARALGDVRSHLKLTPISLKKKNTILIARPPAQVPASGLEARAAAVLANVAAMGIRPIVKPKDIVSGNAKLNLGLVAQVFNANPGLAVATVEEIEVLGDDFAALEVDSKQSRPRTRS
jgi:hypothetical protein